MRRHSVFVVGLIAGLCVLAFFVQVAPAMAADAAKPVGNTLDVHKGTPTLDGEMEDLWQASDVIKTEAKTMGETAVYEECRLLWDENFLYVFAKVSDPVLSAKSSNAWEQDSVEFFIDQNNGKTTSYRSDDAQYRVSFKGAISNSGATASSKFKAVAKVVDGGYVVEAAIPLLKVPGKEGNLMGFDTQVNEDNGSGSRSAIRAWNDTTNTAYQNPSKFGTITLVQ